MVEIIGLVTISALVWLLGWSMAGESESEKRRISMSHEHCRSSESVTYDTRTRHAA